MAAIEDRPIGFGRLKRKEDARFIRGQGQYVDDVQLTGMLHGAVLRSPVAHARIVSIDTSAALQHPKVHAVITGKDLEGLGLAWMPTLSADTQAVLATDKVRFQGQEVAFVIADDRYSARDALELIDVEYDVLPAVVNARKALDAGAPVIRDDKDGQTDNHIFDWESGDKAATDAVFANADVVVAEDMLYPRSHPAPMETCGAIADYDKVDGSLTLWCTTQAPHAHRTLYALVAGLPEHKIRVISPDIGGGFGNKVGIYPGYVCAVVGSIVTGRPVKWMEDRSENLMSTSFARDYVMHGEIAATKDGKILGVRVDVIADHGAFNSTAQPTKYPGRLLPRVHRVLRPGGRPLQRDGRLHEQGARRRRVRMLVPCHRGRVPRRADGRRARPRARRRPGRAAVEEPDPARPVPVRGRRPAGSTTPASTRPRCARRWRWPATTSCAASRPRSASAASSWASAIGFFTEAVGAGPRKHMDILGLGMADAAELRVHPTGKAMLGLSVQTQGQGHETTFAQIVAEELGIPPEDIDVVHGDTDRTPFGLGTYGSRSTPVSGAATAIVARKVRDKARIIASAMLEVSAEDLEWEKGRWFVKGDPEKGATIQEIAMGAHGSVELPEGVEGGLDSETVYNPPNLTFPFGAYICVVDVDAGTGKVTVGGSSPSTTAAPASTRSSSRGRSTAA